MKKHSNNIHKRKASRSHRLDVDIKSSKVVLEEDVDFRLSADEKDKLILELKQRVITLKAANDENHLKIAAYKNEIKSLRLLEAKSKVKI